MKCPECGNVDHVLRCERCAQLIDLSAELKVIEAAKTWVEYNRDDCYQDDTEYGCRGRILMERVEALLAAEKGE